MDKHLRANLWLLGSTVLLCCVVYPAIVWLFSQTFYRAKAEGSLLDKHGQPVTDARNAIGSLLIAQPFSDRRYFHPRPSAVSYNAAASGGSNWGANNNQLRLRVAKTLGPIVKYGAKHPKAGEPVGPDIERWFRTHPPKDGRGVVAQWAETHPAAAVAWVKDSKGNMACVEQWRASHADEVARWIRQNPTTPEPKAEDLAVPFFVSFAAEHPGAFPLAIEHAAGDGTSEISLVPTTEGAEIQANLFEMWLEENVGVDLEQVPADLVTASGSGLDPHITLKNALFQLDSVASQRAAETNRSLPEVRKEIGDLLQLKARAPLGGLAGVPLVNVLDMNLALDEQFASRVGASGK
jgi:K+-transporting ATPase ATPase C chain